MVGRIFSLLLVYVMVAATRVNLAAQSGSTGGVSRASTEFAIETWRSDNGLPQDTVSAVIQTRRGYIWAGTYNGLVEFDGLRFKVFDSSNTKGLANSRITSLLEDSRGNVWIGHDTGEVSRHTDGEFSTVLSKSALTSVPVKDFAEDDKGDVWALNQLGEALRIRDGRVICPPPLMGKDAFVNPRVVADARRNIYVVRNGVVARLTPDGFKLMDFSDPSVRPYYPALAAARDGQIWVLGEGQVRKWDGTNWTADLGLVPWGDASLTTVMETSTGRLIVGTLHQGLYVFDAGSGWFIVNRKDGLPQDWVCSLEEDREGNLWVGTGGGLALLRERKVMMYSPPDAWQNRPVNSIVRTFDGKVWAATEGAGIYSFDGVIWKNYGAAEGLANQFVWSLFEDSRHQLWAGTWGGGLFRLENGKFVSQTNLIPHVDAVVAIEESPPGTLWVGTSAGLVRIQGNSVERLAVMGGAAAGDVRVVESGTDGEIWIGTQGSGLGLWKDGQFRTFQASDGLPEDFILSLRCETNGTLWIGTLDMGLCRYQNGVFRNITTAHGLSGNTIHRIEDDQLGNFWFNSTKGLFRVAKKELHDCADGKLEVVQALALGKAQGMSTLAGTGGFTPSGFRTPDGQLWFPTARGIAVVSPTESRRSYDPPPVWIEEVLVDNQPVSIRPESGVNRSKRTLGAKKNPPRNTVVLPPGRRQLDVQFTGLSFTAPDQVLFKYGLEGLPSDTVPASTRRRVNYSFLPPGEYVFQVTACNSDGIWNDTGDTLGIIVLPYFWQTWWFKTFLTITSVLMLALIFYLESRRRLRRKLERIAHERELERERARIAQDIHDDLGASLTRIGMLSQSATEDLDDPPRAIVNLNLIYNTARDLTRAMDEIVWAVNPRHDTLDSLTNYIARFAHDFLSAAQIRCRLDAPTQVPDITVRSEIRHNLFLAFKETLNNAVKHSGANEVQVTFELLPAGLKVRVSDDGTGFVPNSNSNTGENRVISGYGVAGIHRRLEQIGGKVEIHSTIGQGTRVELFAPIAGLRETTSQPLGNGS